MAIKASDKARAALDKIVAKMETGDLSPLIEVARIHLDDSCPAAHWTYSNRLLAWLQTRQMDCRGYKQWKKVGRQVMKGSSAAYIIAPRHVYKSDERDDDGKRKIKWTYFVTIPVFPLDATEGDPVEYPGTPVEPMPLAELAAELGIEVEYEPMAMLGSMSTDGKNMRLGTADAKTWFHELTHAIDVRLHGKLESGQHEHQETPAELAAIVLMEVYDIGDRTGNAWKYIEQYADDPVEAIHRAAAKVGKVLDFIFKTERGKNNDEQDKNF